MQILVVDDSPVYQKVFERLLQPDHQLIIAADGQEAWEEMNRQAAPRLVVSDRSMPGMDGLELCRRIRRSSALYATYFILSTVHRERSEISEGFAAGVDDYIVKPFDAAELCARVRVGVRILKMQDTLAARVSELESALGRVRQLQGLLPLCAYCRRVRSDDNYWQELESYLEQHSGTQISHGVCPDCYGRVMRREFGEKTASRSIPDCGAEHGL